MKKLLLILSGALLCFTSCYKEKDPLKASDALVGTGSTLTVWQIHAHIYGSAEPGVDCSVAQLLVFNKDSTGWYYFPTQCDSGDYDTLKFRWITSADNKNLYMSYINGNKVSSQTLGLSYYDQTTLRMHGGSYFKRKLDGYFMAQTEN